MQPHNRLKACPRCGSDELVYESDSQGRSMFVFCMDCDWALEPKRTKRDRGIERSDDFLPPDLSDDDIEVWEDE
ncbi:MAG: Lar family restriction alleviation protein [candidate division Zixibacteria bacterium]|nr:Lar family restriction alleviation protein [candidate division Zixibacteria bacterium]